MHQQIKRLKKCLFCRVRSKCCCCYVVVVVLAFVDVIKHLRLVSCAERKAPFKTLLTDTIKELKAREKRRKIYNSKSILLSRKVPTIRAGMP